jgi:hypothetical protein
MKVVAIVSVKNEVELIARCIEHLSKIGVDRVIVEDYGSDDGTVEVVRGYEEKKVILLPFDESANLDGPSWGLHSGELARKTGADWVLFLDADEFWLPSTGSIKEALARQQAPVLTVSRFNVPLGANGPCAPEDMSPVAYGQTLLFVQPVRDFRDAVNASSPLPWSSGVPVPKIAVRPEFIQTVQGGHHAATGLDGLRCAQVTPGEIVIAHIPFSTRERFQRKVGGIRQTLKLQPNYHAGENTAWHWKRWVRLDDAGLLDEEFERQIVTGAELLTLRREKAVMSVSEYLSRE